VLPGTLPSQSIGCFKRFASDTDGLPDMTLLGADRNIETFNVTNSAQTPCTVEAATLSIAHDSVTTSTSSHRDAVLMGDEAPDTGSASPATCLLPPGQTDRVDLDQATSGAAAESGFSLQATGSVVPFCYPAALSPYRWVLVKISDSQYSTKYLISQVTHTLTRSIYTQSFSMKGNGVTAAAGGSAGGPQPSASFSVSFNIQVSIF
jgi:phage protein D